MATMVDRPETVAEPRLETLERRTRGLGITIAILAIIVLALGGWLLYDYSQRAAVAPSGEIAQLLDDYTVAWNEYDGATFLELTAPGFVYTTAGGMEYDRIDAAAMVSEDLPTHLFHLDRPGDPVMAGDGPWYVAMPIHTTTNVREADGIATLTIIEDGGSFLIFRHEVTGDF